MLMRIEAVASACAAVGCASRLCPASVPWWTEARTTILTANSEQSLRRNTITTIGGFGDGERNAAIVKLCENHSQSEPTARQQ